jgi:rubredoxin
MFFRDICCHMATRERRGRSPLERLRAHYEETRMRCSACGYVDEDGDWTATTTGREVTYEHACPSCGRVDTVVVQL